MISPSRLLTVLLMALVLAVAAGEAKAQRRRGGAQNLPQPGLQSLFPLGLKQGGAVEVTLKGTDLEGMTSLWLDHSGLKAEHVKDQTFKITCGPDTPLGHHDVRALGTYGVSNPRTLVVGDRDEINEVEPNNAPEQATALKFNAIANGAIGAASDVDLFAFEGKKGQRVLIDLEAERVDSQLDATARLLDSEMREIGESRDSYGADPFLDVTLPEDGRYFIKVHDVIYRGGAEYGYRLSLGGGPHLDAIIPAVVREGESTTVTLIGRGLGGESSSDHSLDGRPLERKTVTLTAPTRSDTDPPPASREFVPGIAAGRQGFEYSLAGPNGSSNPIFVSTSTDPVVVDTEPNDDLKQAQKVTAPCAIAGSFGARLDLDIFRFQAKKGEVLVFDARAERVGSPADPVISVQRVTDPAKGTLQDLANGEDTNDRSGFPRLNTASVDATLKWTAPEDGDYLVGISDLYGSQRGGVQLGYRLSIRPERPDFRLFLVPESTNEPDALTIGAGGRALAYALAVRQDGFDGPIRVEAVGLPPGIHCEPAIIPPGQSQVPLVFEAEDGAKAPAAAVQLVGTSRFGDRKEDLAYFRGETKLGPRMIHAAVASSIVWAGPVVPPPQQAQTPPPASRLSRGFVLRVVDPSPMRLNVKNPKITATPGGLVTLDLELTRREGFTEAVAVSLVNPFSAMGNQPPTANIAKGANAGLYAASLPLTLPPGIYTWTLQGAGPFPFNKDPKAKTKPNVNVTEPTNQVTLTVRPAPLTVLIKPVTVKAGGSVELDVNVTRKDGLKEPVAVSLAAPSDLKLSADPIQIEPGKPSKLVIKADAASPAGATVGVAIRATVPVHGEPLDVNQPLTVTIAK